jgi:hypothetical protein
MLSSSFFPSLFVPFAEPRKEVLLVYHLHARAVARDGELEEVSRPEASYLLVGARLDNVGIVRFLREIELRDSLFRAGLGPALPNARAILDTLVARGTIVVLRKRGERALDVGPLREERTIAREFQNLQRDKRVRLPGRRLLLVAGADFGKLPGRSRYQVVPNREATALLLAAAGAPGLDGQARDTLARAAERLAPDWRAPRAPEGLVLLRELPPATAVARSEAPLTPSQLRALKDAAKTVKLEVVVLGPDSELLKIINFAIDAPDGDSHEGDLGSSGRTTIASAKQGRAKVTLHLAE